MLVESLRPKKVLIHLPNNPGGKINYYAAIKDHLESDVTFFYCGLQGRKESKLTLFVRIFQDFWKFYSLLKTTHFDLVLTNPTLTVKSFFRDSIFTLISCRLGFKTIVFWHGWRWDFEQKVVRKIKPYFLQTFGRADAMIFLAKEFARQTQSYGYQKSCYLETTLIEDEILNFQQEEAPSGNRPRQETERVILFLSRVEKPKGIYELLDSYHGLQQKHPDIVLHIAGEGKELAKAKSYVSEKGIPKVSFLGWVKGKQKAAIFHAAHVYVLPSYSEGMPCSLLEAMASGLPIITTDVGGIKDFFEPGKMGYVIQPNDAADLEQKLDLLLSEPAQMHTFGSYNAAYAHAKFTPTRVSSRMEGIFEEVLYPYSVIASTVKV